MAQSLCFSAIAAALPEIARAYGPMGPGIVQLAVAVAALGLIAGAFVSDRFLRLTGTRGSLLIALAVFALAGGAGAAVLPPPLLLLSRFILGVAAACMVTTCVWGIAEAYEGHRRAGVFGIAAALASFMGLVGGVLGGYVAQRGWAYVFLLYPAFAAIWILLVLGGIRQTVPDRHQTTAAATRGAAIPPLSFYILAAVLFAVLFMAGAQLSFVLDADGVHDPASRGLIIAIQTVGGISVGALYGVFERVLKPRGAFLLSLLCLCAGLFLTGFGRSAVLAAVGTGLTGAHFGLLQPYLYQVASDTEDELSRSTGIARLTTFSFLGVFINPFISVPVAAALGLGNLYLVSAGLVAAIGVASVLWPRLASRAPLVRPGLAASGPAGFSEQG